MLTVPEGPYLETEKHKIGSVKFRNVMLISHPCEKNVDVLLLLETEPKARVRPQVKVSCSAPEDDRLRLVTQGPDGGGHYTCLGVLTPGPGSWGPCWQRPATEALLSPKTSESGACRERTPR